MSTQPEQTLENNLIAQLENLGFDRVQIADEKDLIINLKEQLEKHNKTLLSDLEFRRNPQQAGKGQHLCKS